MVIDGVSSNQLMQEMGDIGKSKGGAKEQMKAKLEAAGITKEQVMQAKAQGPDAVKKLFQGTGIQPPGKVMGMSAGYKNQAVEVNSKMNSNSILKQIEIAGGTKEEFANASKNGPDEVKSLFEKYELSFDVRV